VIFNRNEWATPSANFATGGRRVRLDGYRLQPANTIEVFGLNRDRIVLLVVPPYADPDKSHAALMAAAAPNNNSTVDNLLMINTRERKIRTQAASAQERWVSEGDHRFMDAWIASSVKKREVNDRGNREVVRH
jgi:hypothetical protein